MRGRGGRVIYREERFEGGRREEGGRGGSGK